MVSFAQIFLKLALKDAIFFNFQKRPKNAQMAKPFYFWQTVSKKAKFGQMATLLEKDNDNHTDVPKGNMNSSENS